jgi:flagellar hook-associated protein 3 FlgL
MARISIGDMAQNFLLKRQNIALKQDIQRLGTELSTGRVADTARATRGDLVPMAAIESALARAQGFRAATAEAALFTRGAQETLAVVDNLATGFASSLRLAATSGAPVLVASAASDALQRFEGLIAALNTRIGDRTLFAGDQPGLPALAPPAVILDALGAAVTAAGATTAPEVEAAVAAWFADPAGYAATAYLGGAPLAALPVTPEDSARFDVTALDPAIRATVEALALGALLTRPAAPALAAERADLALRAADRLATTATDRALLAGRVGTVEERIDRAASRNQAETAALELARAAIVEADPYESATRLEAAQGRLEALYAVTARLARLSLVDFLR